MKIPALLGAIAIGVALVPAFAQDSPAIPADDPYRALEDAARPESQAFFRVQA